MNIQDIKPLTIDQYESAKNRALARVEARIGEKPSRDKFQREFGRLWTILDGLALVIFIAALLVSSLHILTWAGVEAQRIYHDQTILGWTVDNLTFGRIHQLGLIALSESSILLFTIMFRLTRSWVRWILLVLALGATGFVFSANLSSGITPFVALLVPGFTVGISFRLEMIVVESMKRRREVDEKYRAALAVWEESSHDATQHPDYQPTLKRELWEKLVSLKANRDFVDAPPAFKNEAVSRELARELWAYQDGSPAPFLGATQVDEKPADSPRPFGSTAPDQAEIVSIPMSSHANGHGGNGTGQNHHSN